MSEIESRRAAEVLSRYWALEPTAGSLLEAEEAVSEAIGVPATIAIMYPGALVRVHDGPRIIRRFIVTAPRWASKDR